MSSKYLILCILTAFLIVGLYHIFAVGRFHYPEFKLKAGQVAESEVVAPFDFPILKTQEQLSMEKEQKSSTIPMPYMLNDEQLFHALSIIDKLWSIFYENPKADIIELNSEIAKAGYTLPANALLFTQKASTRDRLYDELRDVLTDMYRKGIHNLTEKDSIYIYEENDFKKYPQSAFLSLSDAAQKLESTDVLLKEFVIALKTQLLQANLVPDIELYRQLTQQVVNSIPQTEGMVLKNEVIIRKNSRVSSNEIGKLESLQEAYRYRNVQKNALQQLMLALGLLLFVLLILMLANHYYSTLSTKSPIVQATDFLPVNIGFVLMVVFGIVVNHFFSVNNLVIPFAMVSVSAAILVGMDFAILYSICNMLILSPFVNWETYTPVIFILSTMITLVMIKRQHAQHEYLTIWFYMALSTSLVNIAISVYKNDSVMVVFRNIGLSLISSAFSIIGIIIIVPYLERKWNRATKQTLLELLDFNHPLLKQLATIAVGTYHHSLIVGNLAERAAEAIGANPLLARVGSYYHDIGKIVNTDIFTENNEDSSDIHDTMSPDQSASLIKNHVLEGISLAKNYNIPQPVIDIIMQHHGNGTIRYFLDRAEKQNLQINNESYQYPGPRPQTKEAVLVMLADMIESTTKAKTIRSEDEIVKIIDDTTTRIIRDGQLDEAPITLKDLHIIKMSMLPVLLSIYRKRLDYPEENGKR